MQYFVKIILLVKKGAPFQHSLSCFDTRSNFLFNFLQSITIHNRTAKTFHNKLYFLPSCLSNNQILCYPIAL